MTGSYVHHDSSIDFVFSQEYTNYRFKWKRKKDSFEEFVFLEDTNYEFICMTWLIRRARICHRKEIVYVCAARISLVMNMRHEREKSNEWVVSHLFFSPKEYTTNHNEKDIVFMYASASLPPSLPPSLHPSAVPSSFSSPRWLARVLVLSPFYNAVYTNKHYIHLSINISIYLYIYISIYLNIYRSIYDI